jgi:hypothetical protein
VAKEAFEHQKKRKDLGIRWLPKPATRKTYRHVHLVYDALKQKKSDKYLQTSSFTED